MIRLIVLLVCAGLLVAACGGGGDDAPNGPLSAEETLGAAVEKMEGLSSYRSVLVATGAPNEVPDFVTYTVDVERDGDYRLIVDFGCDIIASSPVEDGPSCEADQESTFYNSNIGEFVVFKDRIFIRGCLSEDEGCNPWKDDEANWLWYPLTGPTWVMPEYPLFVLDGAEDVEPAALAEADHPGELRFSGRFDSLRTTIASAREWIDENRDVPGFSEAEANFEEPSEGEYRFAHENPSPFEVVVSADDGLVRRMSFELPGEETPAGQIDFFEVEVSFSRFDEAEVERPY